MRTIREWAVAMVLIILGSALAQSSPAATQSFDRQRGARVSRDVQRHNHKRLDHFNRAHRFGYDDGLSDGANDRRTGYSFRPTHYDNYKNADRGCPFANRERYRRIYRQAYEQGYRRGYYER